MDNITDKIDNRKRVAQNLTDVKQGCLINLTPQKSFAQN